MFVNSFDNRKNVGKMREEAAAAGRREADLRRAEEQRKQTEALADTTSKNHLELLGELAAVKRQLAELSHAAGSGSQSNTRDRVVLSATELKEAPDQSQFGGRPGTEIGTTSPKVAAAPTGPATAGVTINCTPQQLGTAAFQQTLAALTSSGIPVSVALVSSGELG